MTPVPGVRLEGIERRPGLVAYVPAGRGLTLGDRGRSDPGSGPLGSPIRPILPPAALMFFRFRAPLVGIRRALTVGPIAAPQGAGRIYDPGDVASGREHITYRS